MRIVWEMACKLMWTIKSTGREIQANININTLSKIFSQKVKFSKSSH